MRSIIGIELHIQVNRVESKLFCSCPTNYYSAEANRNTCPVCLGLPGSLPVVNYSVIEKATRLALALSSRISGSLIFVRKHYFYPDLPKNYQISQYDRAGMVPFASGGYLDIGFGGSNKRIRIRRINIEEDPAKISYPEGDPLKSPYSLIDYNRSGMPLLEIVTEADMESSKEVRAFLEKILTLVDYLDICDPDLEGAFRVDANISIEGGERVEVKNIGSLRDVEKAINYELTRQRNIIRAGGSVRRETRHWDSARGVTVTSRAKEYEEDYRYFPDPDLPPIEITKEFIDNVSSNMPELPWVRAERFIESYGLSRYEANVLTSRRWLADYFENALKYYGNPSKLADLLINDFLGIVNEHGGSPRVVKGSPDKVGKLLSFLDRGVISIKILKQILPDVVLRDLDPEEIIRSRGLDVISDRSVIEKLVDEVFRENPKAVEDAKKNPKAINFLIGKVMAKTRGKAHPAIVREVVARKLRE